MPAEGAPVRRLALALAAIAAASPSWAGPLVVVAAPRDPVVTNPQALYRPDDPQLVGRIVSLDGAVPTFDGETVRCDRPSVTRARTTAAKLFPMLFPARTDHGRRRQARPADFGLTLAPGTPLTATTVRCPAARGPQASYLAAVSFPLTDGRFAFWREEVDNHLLLLRPAIGPIRASFDCAKARSQTERAICADRSLAGWDVSVAKAFGESSTSTQEQRAWLIERDRCGAADKACLRESMSLRANNLLH